ncbi:hypothetical protein AGMMS49941_10350 [Deferribacterales bacterium]|nr:hypothetical protein AGMMS49941_10350 [Deferribacterales bacterium]
MKSPPYFSHFAIKTSHYNVPNVSMYNKYNYTFSLILTLLCPSVKPKFTKNKKCFNGADN